MHLTRREFIKNVGLAVASLAMARCFLITETKDSGRGRLRRCWLLLDWLAQETQRNPIHSNRLQDQLVADHCTHLNDLVATGELEPAVADQLQAAFEKAAYHAWCINTSRNCYPSIEPNYTSPSAGQLMQQVSILARTAEHGEMDAEAIAQAQAAIERDIAFLALSEKETQALYDALAEAGGNPHGFPPFEELELEIPPQATEAARFLVEVLLEKQNGS
jgi:hypothetical protein